MGNIDVHILDSLQELTLAVGRIEGSMASKEFVAEKLDAHCKNQSHYNKHAILKIVDTDSEVATERRTHREIAVAWIKDGAKWITLGVILFGAITQLLSCYDGLM